MSDKNNNINTEPEMIKTENGEIAIDPAVMIECIDDVNAMVEGHVRILNAVKSVMNHFIENGVDTKDAALIAVELQRRAGKKANNLVHMDN